MSRIRLLAFLSLAVLALASGCGSPRVRIEWSRPPALKIDPQKGIAIKVEADGPRPTGGEILDVVLDAKRLQVLNKWAAIPTVRDEFDVRLKRAGYVVVPESEAAYILRVRPTSWKFQLARRPGNIQEGEGRLDVRVDVLDARVPSTAPPLYVEEYWAEAGAGDLGEPEAMLRASRSIVEPFLGDLQPSRVSAQVELDDEDPACETGIELCRQNRFEAAYEAFAAAVEAHPGSAPATYDLAVMCEVKGEYDRAEALLKQATRLGSKPMYFAALERVRGARRDAAGFK